MQWEAEQTRPTCSGNGFSNIGAADYGWQLQWSQQQQQQTQHQQQQQHHRQQEQMQQLQMQQQQMQQQQMQQQQMQQQQMQQQQMQQQQQLQQQQQQQPPPPAYAVVSAPPDYPGGPYPGAPFTGALHYGVPAYYANAPGAVGFGHPVVSQNVQFNMINAAAAPPPVIVTQTAPIVLSPPSYLGWSIFNCLCCFWPLGLAAIIYSVKVGNACNHDEARRHSLTARNLNIASTTLAPILAIIIVGAVLGSAATAAIHQSSYIAPAYFSYGYTSYYSYLMYYTYSGSYSYLAYSYDWLNRKYSYKATVYTTLTAFKYAIGSHYQYRSDTFYYG